MAIQDRIVNEAREKYIEQASIPRKIINKYKTRIENGKVIIYERK